MVSVMYAIHVACGGPFETKKAKNDPGKNIPFFFFILFILILI